MPAIHPRRLGLLAAAVTSVLLTSACGSFTESQRSWLTSITPYRVDVVQGNFVSKEQVEQLKPGMSRQQAREILGTSLLTDVFHTNRWDYVFTIRRQGVEPQQRRLTLYFNGELLDRFEGDPMPSEQEFVAQLDTRKRANGKVPQLEATPEQLEKLAPTKTPTGTEAAASLAPLPPSYPPLESR